jgi:hypothetical protein
VHPPKHWHVFLVLQSRILLNVSKGEMDFYLFYYQVRGPFAIHLVVRHFHPYYRFVHYHHCRYFTYLPCWNHLVRRHCLVLPPSLKQLMLLSPELFTDSSSPSPLSLDSSDPESGVVVVINSVFSSPFLLLSLGSSSLLRVL